MCKGTPLGELIDNRIKDLGLSREELGRRLGYTNSAKASGRVDALCCGHITSRKSVSALNRLAAALDVNESVVTEAVNETRVLHDNGKILREQNERLAQEAKKQAWRAAFRPHAVLQTERRVPTQITICGMVGGPRRFLVIPLDASKPPITFVRQAMTGLPKPDQAGDRHVPFFGKALGLVVNYNVDCAIRFDLHGNPLDMLGHAYVPGNVDVGMGKGRALKPIPKLLFKV